MRGRRRCSGAAAPTTTAPSSPRTTRRSNADLAELAVAGFDTHLYYDWPMTRLVARASRLVAVHSPALAAAARRRCPRRACRPQSTSVMGVLVDRPRRKRRGPARAGPLASRPTRRVRLLRRTLARQAASADSRRVRRHAPIRASGSSAPGRRSRPNTTTFARDIERLGLDATSPSPATRDRRGLHRQHRRLRRRAQPALADCARDVRPVAALPRRRQADGDRRPGAPGGCADARSPDVAADARRGVGALRPCASRSTSSTRTTRFGWRCAASAPIALLRAALGRPAGSYWQREHSIERMVADYRNLIEDAVRRPIPRVSLPPHLLDEGRDTLDRLMAPFGRLSPFAGCDGRGRSPIDQ